ncbi:MAG TPA: Gfo/Idh/MocA family oxidoreductase [Candidatus Methylacidiphilales bacterium]|jgi:predicted dehydrogenase|nr:Gfo/Idh/MocA family oxidoreductase [Candidatus Methylacidiphilales bacterium]
MSSEPKPIRLGLLGAGARLCVVVRHLLREVPQGRITIASAYDPNPDAISSLRAEFGAGIESAETEAALATHPGVDWVLIGSWNNLHKRHAVAALLAGRDVFCEKPLATTLDDCLAIHEAVKKSGRIFSFGLVLRYSPHYRKIKELIAAGTIGQIISFEFNETLGFNHGGYIFGNWRRKSEYSGGHLLEKCCHDLDLANWMVDSLPVTVASFGGTDFFVPGNEHHAARIGPNAKGRPAYRGWDDPQGVSPFAPGADIADNQVAILEYANGARGTFHTNCNTAILERRFYICGTEGTLRADAVTGDIEWKRIGHDTPTERVNRGHAGGHAGGDEHMARALAATMLDGVPPQATVDDGLRSCLPALALDAAMRGRKVVDLRPDWKTAGVTI